LFASPRASSGALPLPEAGLCVSRFDLDRELGAVFREAGGDLREGERWNGQWGADGVVRATGRRVAANPGAGRFIGLKAHALGAALEADVEVHLVPGGYVGICRLDEEKVNVCGLFRRRPAAADLAGRWREWLAGSAGSFLRRRLESATFAGETFCAVAGLDLRPRSAAGAGECAIGDSLTMIAPVAGNGMSLAFESAALAARELEGYSRGETSWETARGAVATGCDARFAARLRWARAAHLGLLALPIGDLMARCVSWAPGLWPFLFARTR
jgi:flavin-dependent dehydrogenase